MPFFHRKTRRPVSPKRRKAKPRMERLEDRVVPATFTVNTLADTVDVNSAVTSLRDAITAANSQAGDDIINFSVTGTINLTGALPDLSSNIQIQGPGAASLTVRRDTGGDYRIFTVVGGPTVVLDGLTISNGFAPGDYGGGIDNQEGTLTVSDCTLAGNSATPATYEVGGGYVLYLGGEGGGIYNNGATLTVIGSTLSGNSVYGDYGVPDNVNSFGDSIPGGGGIYNGSGTLTVTNSTLSGNSAYGYGNGGYGGGIGNANGTLTVTNSTLSGNSAYYGGGIVNDSGTGTVSNSTLSGNSATYGGGGIDNGGTLTVINSTLSNNSANNGGGIVNTVTLTLNNTIVANSASGGDVFDRGTLTGSHNLIEDGSDGLPDTITGDPKLGPLADNGGPTFTQALLPGSPAIDAGDNTLIPAGVTTDQRGTGYARIENGTVDIGAFEVVVPDASLSGIVFSDFNNDGQVDFGEQGIPSVPITVTGIDDLGQAVNLSTTTDGAGTFVFLNLRPGTYTIIEAEQPAGYTPGIATVGTGGGTVSGAQFTGINLVAGEDAMNYNYGEQPAATGPIHQGQTAGIGFWNNKNGQALIKALNGGVGTQLGNWLAATFPHLFGQDAGTSDLAGKNNASVASFFQGRFVIHGQKLDAQVLATALAVYVTDPTLDSTGVGTQYGFTVGGNGLATATYNVGASGAAFGMADNTKMTVMDILLAADSQAVDGVLYNGDSVKSNKANNVFSGINEAGGI